MLAGFLIESDGVKGDDGVVDLALPGAQRFLKPGLNVLLRELDILGGIGSLIESPGFYPNLTGTESLRIFATLRGVPDNHAIKDALDLVELSYKDKKLFS